MLYGLYLSAAGLKAQEYRQNVIANNLANSQTTGFKRDLAILTSRANAVDEDGTVAQYRTPVLDQQGGGVFAAPTAVDLSQGTVTDSANATDLALEGPGFFTVQGADQKTLLTRDGQFLINNNHQLVTANDGRLVLDNAGKPIELNPALAVDVYQNGEIHQGGETVATLGVVNVKDPRSIVKYGENCLSVQDPQQLEAAPANTLVRQRAIEHSGVDPMVEMVNMMEGQRVFEANAKMIKYQDQTLASLETVGRVA